MMIPHIPWPDAALGVALAVSLAGALGVVAMMLPPLERLQQQDLEKFPDLKRWFNAIASRPATLRAYARASEFPSRPVVDEESRKILFGQTAESARLRLAAGAQR